MVPHFMCPAGHQVGSIPPPNEPGQLVPYSSTGWKVAPDGTVTGPRLAPGDSTMLRRASVVVSPMPRLGTKGIGMCPNHSS